MPFDEEQRVLLPSVEIAFTPKISFTLPLVIRKRQRMCQKRYKSIETQKQLREQIKRFGELVLISEDVRRFSAVDLQRIHALLDVMKGSISTGFGYIDANLDQLYHMKETI